MVADPPAAWVVAVVLPEQLIHAGGDRADDGELGKVRAEPGPEPVVGARLIDGARVYLEPVPHQPPVDDPESHAHHGGAYQADRDDGAPPLHPCSPPRAVRSRASSGSVLQDLAYGVPSPAQLDAHHDLRHAVDDAEQAEQQREGDRTDAGTGEQHHTERDGHKPAQDEQRAGARGLAALEGSEDLDEPADDRPDADDQHQHQRGGPGPHQRDHAGGQADQPEQQVAEDRPGGTAAEGPHGLQARVDERVDREQDDQRINGYVGPGEGDDADDDGEDAEQDQRGGGRFEHDLCSLRVGQGDTAGGRPHRRPGAGASAPYRCSGRSVQRRRWPGGPVLLVQLVQLGAERDPRDAVEDAEQAEQQREGDRADVGAGEQQDAERHRYKPSEDEHRPHARGLPAAEPAGDLDDAAHHGPDADDQDQHQRGRTRPDDGDHAGRQADQREQQVAEDRPGGAAAEGPHGLQARVDERVDREQQDQRINGHAWPGEGDDPDDDGENAQQDQS